jgi:hypothetical protein
VRLLNQIPVLDKGFVAGLAFHMSDKDIEYVWIDLRRGAFKAELLDMAQATLVIKCPLFVHLWLAEFSFTVVKCKQDGELDAYTPDVSDIQTGDLGLDRDIGQDIAATQAALLINPKAYRQDGCEKFISQVNTPISVYNQLVVSGSLKTWMDLVSTEKLPKPIEAYRKAIEDVLLTEWNKLHEYQEQLNQCHERKNRTRSSGTQPTQAP